MATCLQGEVVAKRDVTKHSPTGPGNYVHLKALGTPWRETSGANGPGQCPMLHRTGHAWDLFSASRNRHCANETQRAQEHGVRGVCTGTSQGLHTLHSTFRAALPQVMHWALRE